MTTTETTPATAALVRGSDPAAPLTIPLGVLGALARCASTDPQRMMGMNGVAIDRATNIAMATDGTAALVVPFPSSDRAPAGTPLTILGARDIARVEKGIGPKARHRADATVRMASTDGATLTISRRAGTDEKTAGKIPEGEHNVATIAPMTGRHPSFPDIAAVLPSADRVRAWVAVDADALAALAGAIRDAGAAIIGEVPASEGPTAPVILGIAGPHDAIIVRSTGRTGIHGVIMPVSPGDNVPRVTDPETESDLVADARREQRQAESRLTNAVAELRAVRILKERAERERDAALATLDTIRRAVNTVS